MKTLLQRTLAASGRGAYCTFVMSLPGCATVSGTERFRQRTSSVHPHHFRPLRELWASSIGLGTYLGDADDPTDLLYAEAIRSAISLGCNVIDTAINYRCQHSERTIGRTLEALIAQQHLTRDEVILCTKGGYFPFDGEVPTNPARYLTDTVINPGLASYDEIVAGCHCLSPTYLNHALDTSLANLRVQTIDIYYLHNPEQQLDEVSPELFLQRMEAAFGWLEARVRDGKIRLYGTATWNGYRSAPTAKGSLSLDTLVRLAQRVGGLDHHFRAIQLPYNLAMPEACSFKNQTVDGETMTILDAAQRLQLSVIVSASLLQSQLARMPAHLEQHIPGLSSSAQRALQFVRSTPGVTTALVGMKQRAHVEDNLALAHHPPLAREAIHTLFGSKRTTPRHE